MTTAAPGASESATPKSAAVGASAGFRRRNIYFSLGAQWFSALLSIASSVLVARMMLPAELGVFTVTMAMCSVFGTLQMAGASEYLLYSQSLERDDRRSVFAMTLILTFAVCALLVLGRPLWIWLYGHAGIADVAMVIALQMALWVVVSPIHGMLMRLERFDRISGVSLVQNLTLSGLQITFAWLGFSYMGLAYAALISSVVGACGFFIVGREHALFSPRFRGLAPVLSYGGKLFGANALNVLNTNIAAMMLGALSGVGVAALFGRANMISQIYGQTIARAVDPLVNARIAAARREGEGTFDTLAASCGMLITASLAFFGFVALAAHLIVPLIFGQQWSAAAPAMQVLALGFIVWPLTAPTSAVLLAHGAPASLIRVRAVNLVARASAIFLLAPYGLTLVAAGVSFSIFINLLQSLHAMRRVAGLDLGALGRAIAPSIACAALPLVFTFLTLRALEQIGADRWLTLIAAGGVMGTAQLVSLFVFRHPLWHEIRRLLGRLPGLH